METALREYLLQIFTIVICQFAFDRSVADRTARRLVAPNSEQVIRDKKLAEEGDCRQFEEMAAHPAAA